MLRTRPLALVVALLAPSTVLAGAPPTEPAPATPALPAALPPAGSEAERKEVEQLTKLDLGKQWRSYQTERKDENFYHFTEKKFRRGRDAGRFTAMAGVGGLFAGGALLSVALLREEGPTPMTVTGYAIVGVSGLATIAGAIVWGIYYKRLERLEGAEGRYFTLGPRGRVRVHGGGPGLRLVF